MRQDVSQCGYNEMQKRKKEENENNKKREGGRGGIVGGIVMGMSVGGGRHKGQRSKLVRSQRRRNDAKTTTPRTFLAPSSPTGLGYPYPHPILRLRLVSIISSLQSLRNGSPKRHCEYRHAQPSSN